MKIKKAISNLLMSLIFLQSQISFAAWSAPSAPSAPPASANGSNIDSDAFLVQKETSTAKAGSVYVTPTKKNEVLFKVSIWGAVQHPGVHYMPLGTHLLDGLSIAGGPIDRADMEHLSLSSHEAGKSTLKTISVTEALEHNEFNPLLLPEDVLVVREDRSMEKTSLYLQIGTFIISAVAAGLLISEHR